MNKEDASNGDVLINPSSRARRSYRRHLKWIVPVLVVGALGAVWAMAPSDNEDGDSTSLAARLEFEEVVIADLAEVTTFAGTLGFDEGDPITAGSTGTLTAAAEEGSVVTEGQVLFAIDDEQVALLYGDTTAWRAMGLLPELEQFTPRMQGTVTWLAEEGATISAGEVLMEIDEEPVVVLYGDVPAYRMMRRNTQGTDVQQLQTALQALGYDPDGNMDDPGNFDWWTQEYVDEWQEDVGAPEDGRVDLGEVVFVPGPFVIHEWSVSIGSQIGGSPAATTYTAEEATEGDDVLALEEALVRLGYDGGGAVVVDGVFDPATEAAVEEWQESLSADVDGVVAPGDVVFLPQAVRISDRIAEPGDTVGPGTPVLATSPDVIVGPRASQVASSAE